MKFTTLIPVRRNDGTAVKPSITGHWIDEDDVEFTDVCLKVSIECDRNRLAKAIKAVKRLGRKLGQRAMYFEVTGYDGVQILRVE